MRTIITREIENVSDFKNKLLQWANSFHEVIFLDSNQSQSKYSKYDCILAIEAFTSIRTDYNNAFHDLNEYQQHTKDWLFGYLTYDLKNDTEKLTSTNFDGLQFPDLFFFQPKKIITLQGEVVEMHYLKLCDEEIENDLEEILKIELREVSQNSVHIQQRIPRDHYLHKVLTMQEHIQKGDIYEANFCMEFFAENTTIDPLSVYQKLNSISTPPFAVYLKNQNHYLLCASPERYLKKEGYKIISQPIKGTAKRVEDISLDTKSKKELQNNPKERSENIMIVDLVRNDLSRTAVKGSVKVEELCEVYSFKQVHQMISTVVSEVEETCSPVEVIKTTFPMGSMTGAPKISAMEIIENLEDTKRGLYSGSVGYFEPNGNFDFNVVIRSILYNSSQNYISFSVGSAITSKSTPEKEYEECLLKAKAMFEVLS